MRIGMLLDKAFPPDPRVANEARSLAAAGHEVRLLCLRFDETTAARETWQGVQVERVSIERQFYKKASALALVWPGYFSFWRRALSRFLEAHRIEALHVHDLPLLGVGLQAARARGIRVVADLHENYPAAIGLYDYANRFPGNLLISAAKWRQFERRHLPAADRIIVVVEEAAERLGAYRIPAAKVAVVSNTVEVDEFESFPLDRELIARGASGFTLSYLGGFDRHRGLETVIDAAAILQPTWPELRISLVGDGATRRPLEERARERGLTGVVEFAGWQSFQRFPAYVAGSKLCLIPHLKSEHTDTTIPHKLFHYMLLERPVVSSDCRPLRRILDSTGAGAVYPSGDAAGMASAIRRLADPAVAAEAGRRGRKAVLETYNWKRSAERLLALYADLEREVA